MLDQEVYGFGTKYKMQLPSSSFSVFLLRDATVSNKWIDAGPEIQNNEYRASCLGEKQCTVYPLSLKNTIGPQRTGPEDPPPLLGNCLSKRKFWYYLSLRVITRVI
jgi:hypothetical protein